MPLKAAMVLTTIGESSVLDGYYANFLEHHHLEQVRVIVIPDRKTPAATYERCARLRKLGLSIDCPGLEEQERFLRKIGFLPELIPHDSDNRRNVGYLMALEEPIDFLISIDDDNFCVPEEDFFAQHAVVCDGRRSLTVIEADGGWFNVCEQLVIEPGVTTYARGFPYFARHRERKSRKEEYAGAIRMNAGLWLQEPDLDALTWLNAPVRSTGVRGDSIVLGSRTWSPVNTQNTALHRDVIPSYYFVQMAFPVSGMRIDRYGDIFSGYFSQACAKSMGDTVRVGTPIAVHARNCHNYLKDATQELACVCLLEDLLPWLQEQRLEGKSYAEKYVSLSELLEDALSSFKGFIWTEETAKFFHSTANIMRQWATTCRCLGA
jgi:reversibly glycosylated polypeptide